MNFGLFKAGAAFLVAWIIALIGALSVSRGARYAPGWRFEIACMVAGFIYEGSAF